MRERKTYVKVISFILILTFILISADHVLKVKYVDGIYSMQRFYELEDNSVDVLFLGSSHAFETYNTSVLWDEYGIASFVLGGSVQPVWNTYFFMKEALKTQTPDLIVLEAYCCTFPVLDELNDYSRQIKNCYGMKPSLNKLEAMCVTTTHSNATFSNNLKFFFPISNYSSRYNELAMEDFVDIKQIRKYENWMGFATNYESEEKDTPCLPHEGPETPMPEEVEEYYRKILKLAEEKQIPILVVVSPYPDITEEDAAIFRYAERITGEYNGAAFWNPALDPSSIGLDYSIHAAPGLHLNEKGNKIYTECFGSFIKSNYSIHDRRGDPGYQSWEDCSTYLKRLDSIDRMRKQHDFESICDQIKDERFCAFILVGKNCTNASELMRPLGETEYEPFSVYCFNDGKNKAWYLNTDVITYQQIYLLFHDDLTYSDRSRLSEEYAAEAKSIKVVIYDTITDNVCDVFTIDGSNPGFADR